MIYLLTFFWFLRQTKVTLFWLYLWQLKEYHLGRFIDHFRTEKGKRLLFNKLGLLKIALIFLLFSSFPYSIGWILITVYFLEIVKGLKDFFDKKLKKPVLTQKTSLLILSALVFQVLFLVFNLKETLYFLTLLLFFDLFTFLVISGIVLLLQPLTVLIRGQTIRKAKKKIKERNDLLVIGITGSYGKTSTKDFLATILSQRFKVLKTKEHQNSEVGISECVLNDLKPEHEIFVVEMGAYNKGGIKLLSDIVKPKIGILTGINQQHMALFGSQENIIKAKYELIESLPRDGLAIFNGDNSYCFDLYQKTMLPKKVYSYSSSICDFPVDIWAEDIKVEKRSLSFMAVTKDERTEFKLNLSGKQNITNILAAILAAKELKMSLKEIALACQNIEPDQGGVKVLKGKKGINIIDSTYSANPDGVLADLDYLKIWDGKKVIIMPCLIELGQDSRKVHKKIGREIEKVCDLAVIITKERFKDIKAGAKEEGIAERNIFFMENPQKIFEKVSGFLSEGGTILLESRVPGKLINLLINENKH